MIHIRDLAWAIFGALASAIFTVCRNAPPAMYGVQIHDEWLAHDQAFIDDLAVAVQASYLRRALDG